MIKKLLFFLVWLLALNSIAIAQSGALKGKILDKKTKETIPFANIIVENNGTQAGGGTSDIDGNYNIKPIQPGKYDVKATFVGYAPVVIRGFIVHSDKTEFLDIEMESTATQLGEIVVVDYKVPIISKDNTVQGGTVTAEEISKMPSRSAASVATTVGGVFSRDGEIGSVRGQRSEGNVMYIDGIKVRGSSSLPESAIEQVSVILGGVPAQYGDATGGIINVTTKGPSRVFAGGLELQTSELLDPFGYNRAGVNFTGPIFRNKKTKEALIGYFVAADFAYEKDKATLPLGMYKVKDEKLAEIIKTPIAISNDGKLTYTAKNITFDDLEKLKYARNADGYNISTTGKIDFKLAKYSNFNIGGSYNTYHEKAYSFYNSIFNSDNNQLATGTTWRVFGRFTQRFPTDRDSKSLVKNVYMSVQADYTSVFNKVQDATLKDNLFAYGNIGKFETSYKAGHSDSISSVTGDTIQITYTGPVRYGVKFTPSEYNPILANYTSNFYTYAEPLNLDQMGGIALINGQTPNYNAYKLFGLPGVRVSQYAYSASQQISANFNLSADVGNHELKFGLIFEKSSSSSYSLNPTYFWQPMRQLVNGHILELANRPDQAIVTYTQATIGGKPKVIEHVDYDHIYNAQAQSNFDRRLREAIGIPVDSKYIIDMDSYDMNSHSITYYDENYVPHTIVMSKPLSVEMFSADEMLNNGNSFGFARGYDFYGNKLKSKPQSLDFFTKKDANGNFTREIAPYEPIYIAGYLQDKFSFEDLVFNVGVRVDRFDANQPSLKDPFSLYPIRTVAEINNSSLIPNPHAQSNWMVYVDDSKNPGTIKGYREGNQWYDAACNPIKDPEIIGGDEGVAPYFVELDDEIRKNNWASCFSDYKPQWSVMPRIAFSFPISDEALFYAHYDVITQRPRTGVSFNPYSYFYWDKENDPQFENAGLKPEKNINYELGFQQKLSNSSALNISAFYSEMRDQIQLLRMKGASPKTYTSYGNIDFGTVKGITIAYDLRRTGNIRLRANYTLQFANGTGSDPKTAEGLIKAKKDNLRTLNPLDYDRRHAISATMDYRYADGIDYNGPIVGGKEILKNTGLSIILNGGSGTPYTRSSKAYFLGENRLAEGLINGARLPWSFRFDGKVDRDIMLASKKDHNGNKKEYYLNVYLQVLNILNTKNVMQVYNYTGNPNDDGYLTSPEGALELSQAENIISMQDLYSIRVNSPYNYSSPRMIRVGLSINF